MLIVMTGLPGSGKTVLAEALGVALPAALVSVDPVELALWRAGLPHTTGVGIASYAVAAAVAEQQLRLGHPVIADAVNAAPHAREIWERLARGYDCPLRIIEVVCSDAELHRQRIEKRAAEQSGPTPGQPAVPLVSWADVQKAGRSYRPWPANRTVIDSAADLEANLKKLLRILALD